MHILELIHRVITTILISLLFISSSSVWAESSRRGLFNTPLNDGHWYAGSASGSLTWNEGDAFNTLGINSGYQWPIANFGSLAFELSFNSSVAGGEVSEAPNGTPIVGNADFQSLGIDWLYRSKGNIYGLAKLGFYQNDTDFEIPLLPTQNALNTTRMERKYNAGIGIGWEIIPSIPLNLEFVYSTITSEASLASLRLLWHFHRQTLKPTPYFSTDEERASNQTISSSLRQPQQPPAQAPTPKSNSLEKRSAGITNPSTAPARNPAVTVTPPSQLGRQVHGKSLYNAERTVKSVGCRAPHVSLMSSRWPKETYQATCSSGALLVVSCEWGSCRVMEE